MLNLLTNQLAQLPAFARSAARSLEAMLMPARRPAMIPVPVSRRRGEPMCGSIYGAANGIPAHAAVRMHDDQVTQGWRKLFFGKTDAGTTGHSQPSRSAP